MLVPLILSDRPSGKDAQWRMSTLANDYKHIECASYAQCNLECSDGMLRAYDVVLQQDVAPASNNHRFTIVLAQRAAWQQLRAALAMPAVLL